MSETSNVCADVWQTCLVCGARPEEDCLDPDRGMRPVGYKGYYKDEEPTSPAHYTRFAIEPIDFISLNNLGFEAGNVVKYVCRYDAKNGLEDLKKAQRYLEFLIAKEEGRKPSECSG